MHHGKKEVVARSKLLQSYCILKFTLHQFVPYGLGHGHVELFGFGVCKMCFSQKRLSNLFLNWGQKRKIESEIRIISKLGNQEKILDSIQEYFTLYLQELLRCGQISKNLPKFDSSYYIIKYYWVT
jgi:hypothetical protein